MRRRDLTAHFNKIGLTISERRDQGAGTANSPKPDSFLHPPWDMQENATSFSKVWSLLRGSGIMP